MPNIFDGNSPEDTESNVDDHYREDIYPRAMQDFVHISDFRRIIGQLLEVINATDFQIASVDLNNLVGARTQQQIYEHDLES